MITAGYRFSVHGGAIFTVKEQSEPLPQALASVEPPAKRARTTASDEPSGVQHDQLAAALFHLIRVRGLPAAGNM